MTDTYLVTEESKLGDVMMCTLPFSRIQQKYPQAVEELGQCGAWTGFYLDKRGIKIDVNIKKK
ncbi:hypothetical protein [Kamptonema sp. UHCC 0994]|uniref:hypothetical protein n=1 Tax=Kamptonema sp. UHCC 0994 TaxID=3031329 RepID=UPI0023B889F6|nr:hypothetical protein [Kamptonema sp. UHCC 0994]MDF0552199.1 hypothetical protein [Kamptonema sp. UHCC 0994]